MAATPQPIELTPPRLRELVRLWRAAFEDAVGVIDTNPIEEQERYLVETVLPAHELRVVLDGGAEGRIDGFIAASPHSVAQLHVRIGRQREGLGSALLAWARERAVAQGDGSLWLYTFARNHRARRFYENHGFHPVAYGYEPTWQLEDVKYAWNAEGRAPPPVVLRGLDHLVLRVTDLDRMLAFYQGALGCTVQRRDDGIGLVQLRAGRSLIDLVPVSGKLGRAGGAAPGAEGRNLDHLCLRVDRFDADAIRAHLAAHGAAGGATELRNGAEGEGPSIYLHDPEGNMVELKGPAGPLPA